jgi:signal transduction histidine kinase
VSSQQSNFFSSHLKNPISYLLLIAILGLTYAFYFTSFRKHVEEYFFDLRTNLKPTIENIDNIVIVEINSATATAVGQEIAYGPRFFYNTLELISKADPTIVAPLLLENFISYKNFYTKKIEQYCSQDPRCLIGTLNYHTKVPSLQKLPKIFANITNKIGGLDTMKFRSNSVVRELPFWGYQEDEAVFMLPSLIANKLGYQISQNEKSFYSVNFWPKSSFTRVQAESLNDPTVLASLKDKIVIFGHSEFKPWLFGTSEQVALNTPLVGSDLNSYRTGEKIIFLTANAVDNLVNDRYLRQATTFSSIVQAVVFIGLLIWIWRFGAILAPIASLTLFIGILAIQTVLMTYFNLIVPAADIFVISIAVIIGGVGLKLRESIEKFANVEVDIESKKVVANLQSRFLDDFAIELKSLNDSMHQDIETVKISLDAPDIFHTVYQKTLQSCQDFSTYLLGVAQFAAIDNKKVRKPEIIKFELEPLLQKVIRRFDGIVTDRKMKIEIIVANLRSVKTSPQIIDTIFFNLLSNAIKYSPDGTTVYVKIESKKGMFSISVRDEGPGIADEYKEKIFERFYRIKNDSVYRVKGTGIGLCLCQYFAGLINSEISLTSVIDEGSTFLLEVPQ